MEENIYVKLKDVVELLDLIEDRDRYHDWSESFEKRDKEVKIKTGALINSGVKMYGFEPRR